MTESASATVARQLATLATETRYEDLPVKAIDYAAMLVCSTAASAALGSGLESARIVRRFLGERGGVPDAQAWFSGDMRLPVAAAARINALCSDAAASDDSDIRNITHPGTTLAAASVAMGEKVRASGKQVLTAIVLGYEVGARINTAVIPGLIWEKGFHGCMVAIFGGAVAAGRLMNLDVGQMTNAIALASTSISGIMAAAHGSFAREHHAGLAAGMGVEAAQLASLGFTAEEAVLEIPKGFFAIYGEDARASGRVARVTENLGKDWKILADMAIKLMPGGHPFHAVAEAAANASRMAGVPPSEITAIRCWRPDAHHFSGPRHPIDLIGVAHSPIFFAAAGAADKEFTWAHVTPEKIHDPAIRRLLDLVESADVPSDGPERYRLGAEVTIETRNGGRFTSQVHAPRGCALLGIEWPDVESKFRALAPNSGMSAGNIDRCVAVFRDFRELHDMQPLVNLLACH